jgi:aminoglycoside 3-N-acetyltransferase
MKRFVRLRLRRRIREEAARSRPVEPAELTAALRRLGVRPGEALLVHSGMDALRPVRGGPVAILAALREAVGPGGTLLMPAFPFAERMRAYVATRPVFDPAKTPSRVGLLTEVFRRMPGVERSLHPTHSVAALGPEAAALVRDHHRAPLAFGPGTPFTRLAERGGRVLMLGVSIERLTLVHAAEDALGDAFPVAVYAPGAVPLPVVVRGESVTVEVRVHDPAVSARRSIPGIVPPLEKRGVVRRGRVEAIDLILIDAAGLLDFLVNEGRRGRTIYGDF